MTRKKGGGFRPIQVREDEPAARWLAGIDARTKEGRLLRKSHDHVLDLVSMDFLHGETVPVPRDPRFEGVMNLRCEDLAGSHRLLYTNVRVEEGTIVLVIDVTTHREYDRLFGIRKK
ncbi:MAG: hypothetical protein WDA16_01405 [Candidatus Thermoplasmatota archaeon]